MGSSSKIRAKTAPAHQRRRQWQAASIELKTEAGSNIRIKAPGQFMRSRLLGSLR